MFDALISLDTTLFLWIQHTFRLEWLDPIVAIYTQMGNAGILWIVLSLLLLVKKSTRVYGISSLLALLFGLLYTNIIIKPLVDRARPWVTITDFVPLIYSSDPHSFPSGHTCASFATSVAWLRTAHRHWLPKVGLVAAILMGLSRLYVGVHYPSDVLVGAIIGTFAAYCGTKVLPLLQKKFPSLM